MPNIDFTITLEGANVVSRKFINVAKNIKNFRPAMKKIGKTFLAGTKNQFAKQGTEFGARWQPLKTATRQQKAKQGTLAQGPLVRTGEMRRSFKSTPKKNEVRISNPTSYYPYHQLGTNKIPSRPMLGINDKYKNIVQKIAHEYINKVISSF